METLAKADIFFVITSISVVLVTVFLLFVLVYALDTLAQLRRGLRTIRKQLEGVADDMEYVRGRMRRGADLVGDNVKEELESLTLRKILYIVVGVVTGILQAKKKKPTRKKKK